MKDNNKPKVKYHKEVGIGTFIFDWVSFSIFAIPVLLGLWIIFDIFHDLLIDSDIIDPVEFFYILCIFFFFYGIYNYRLIKKKPFASITDENIFLDFERKSFSWSDIQEVKLEGNKKLVITHFDKGKHKKQKFDLKWLQKKEEFISNVKNNCSTRDIPYHESEEVSFW